MDGKMKNFDGNVVGDDCQQSKGKPIEQKTQKAPKSPSRPCILCNGAHFDQKCPKYQEFKRKEEARKKKKADAENQAKIEDFFLVDGQLIKMKLDRTSKIDFISVNTWKSMKKPRLSKPDMVVSRNGFGVIKCHGYMTSFIIDPETDMIIAESKLYVIQHDENVMGFQSMKGLDWIRRINFVGKTSQVAKNVGSKTFDHKKTKKYDVPMKELDDFKVESSQLPFKTHSGCSTPVQVKPDDLEQVTAVTRLKQAEENGFPQKGQIMASEEETSCIMAGAKELKDENRISSIMLDLSYELLAKETENDKLLTKIKSWIKNGWPNSKKVSKMYDPYMKIKDKLSLRNDLICYGTKIIVPEEVKKKLLKWFSVLKWLHYEETGQLELAKMAESVFYWPKMEDGKMYGMF
uniref:Uncharacterized protein n=1 Tax=Panagrolaimus sp. JU765 TaxID=591449 RepID=A0AC34RLB0_9BILA